MKSLQAQKVRLLKWLARQQKISIQTGLSGTYNNFVRCVNEKVDWDNLFTRMGEMENEAISDAIDAVAREKGIELENE